MKSEIQHLETTIIEMETRFSQNQPVDIALLLAKTKRLTQLRVDMAREEGLRAGLVIQDLKKQKEAVAGEEFSVPLEKSPFPEIMGFRANIAPKSGTTAEIPVDLQNFNQPYVENAETFPVQTPFSFPQPSIPENIAGKFMEKYSELNLGKYIMAILAAILALAGTVLLGALMWEQISNEMKAGFFGIVATLMVFLPFRHIMAKEIRQSNGFLTSLMGSGLSIHYINCIFMGTAWGLLSDELLLMSLVSLIFLTVYLSHHIKSNTLLIVSYLGNYTTYFLLVLKEMSLNNLYIALILLLASTLFLIAYTLKNEWTYGVTKVSSAILGLLVLMQGNRSVKMANYDFYRGITDTNTDFLRHFESNSPYFPLFLVLLFFATIIGLVMGYATSRSSEYDLTQESIAQDSTGFQSIALFLTYFSFGTVFWESPIALFVVISSTFFLNKAKSTATLLSTPFVFYLLAELTEILVEQLHFQNKNDGHELIYFYSLVIVGLGLHFLTRFSESKRYKVSVFAYTLMAFLLFIVEFHHIWEALPILILFACLFVQGYQDLDDHPNISLFQLAVYIPISSILSKCLWVYSGKIDDYFEYLPVIILMVSSGLSFAQRYFEKFQYEDKFCQLIFATKILSYFRVSIDLLHGRQELSLLLLQTVAIILVLGELFYRISFADRKSAIEYEKPICLILSLVGIISWTESTPLGDFSVTSSILILLVGCVSIYLGFREEEVEMRHFGLGLAILSVVKMVTVDISSTDSIIRVVALIFGAAVCFVISCVYNKLDPNDKKIPSEEENTPPEG